MPYPPTEWKMIQEESRKMPLRYRAVVLLVLGMAAAFASNIIVDRYCPEYLGWNVIRVAEIVGSLILFLIVGTLICIWIKQAAGFLMASGVVMFGLAAIIVNGRDDTPSCKQHAAADQAMNQYAYYQSCLTTAETVPPMSGWELYYRSQVCICGSKQFTQVLTIDDERRIYARGSMDAEQWQRLGVGPATTCIASIIARYPNFLSK
jgi:hypothetical protein